MRNGDIIKLAKKAGIEVIESGYDMMFSGKAGATMFKLPGLKWEGFSRGADGEQLRIEGNKPAVASWCLAAAGGV